MKANQKPTFNGASEMSCTQVSSNWVNRLWPNGTSTQPYHLAQVSVCPSLQGVFWSFTIILNHPVPCSTLRCSTKKCKIFPSECIRLAWQSVSFGTQFLGNLSIFRLLILRWKALKHCNNCNDCACITKIARLRRAALAIVLFRLKFNFSQIFCNNSINNIHNIYCMHNIASCIILHHA